MGSSQHASVAPLHTWLMCTSTVLSRTGHAYTETAYADGATFVNQLRLGIGYHL